MQGQWLAAAMDRKDPAFFCLCKQDFPKVGKRKESRYLRGSVYDIELLNVINNKKQRRRGKVFNVDGGSPSRGQLRHTTTNHRYTQ